MKTVFYAVLTLMLIVVQTTAFHFVPWTGMFPDVVLVLAVYGGLAWGRMPGLQFGGLVGFIQDLTLYGVLGINLFSKAFIGYAIGAVREKYIHDSPLSRVIIVVAATFFDMAVYQALTGALYGWRFSVSLDPATVQRLALNLAFAIIAIPAIAAADSKIDEARGEGDKGLI